jgi:hypothetical protein
MDVFPPHEEIEIYIDHTPRNSDADQEQKPTDETRKLAISLDLELQNTIVQPAQMQLESIKKKFESTQWYTKPFTIQHHHAYLILGYRR